MMKFADAPYNSLLRTVDRVGQQVRYMYYERRHGEALEGFLAASGIATIQGQHWQRTGL